jgi:NADPH-dependent glutamate synthase beta subunit-like oxidoreductase
MNIPTDSLCELVIPISYGSTAVIETGKWGFQKPDTNLLTAPCQEACPAGINIPEVLYFISEGRKDEALFSMLMENPFPGACGRACFHPCEANCIRAQYDESVSIQALEKYVSDRASVQIEKIQPIANESAKRIAVVGGGPSGLSCAYFLSLLGHRVTIFEAKREPGGVLRWGIPEYRLPKSILRKEIRRILSLPIEMKTGVRVGRDIPFEDLDHFDAIFLSPGAGLNPSLGIEGEGLKKVWKGGEFLERINSKEKVILGKETLVVGGGNTAIDVARSALRLGSQVTLAYRRTRNEMPAIRDEIHEAEEEGVRFEFLVQPVKIHPGKKKRLAVKFQRMKLGGPDATGRSRALPVKGEFLTLETDGLITAVGERVELAWVPKPFVKNDLIGLNPSPRVFAGGDAVDQPRTIVTAIAAGKKAAISMDLSLRGNSDKALLSRIRAGNKGSLSMASYLSMREGEKWLEPKGVAAYQQMNPIYFKASHRVKIRKRSRAKSLKKFSEVNMGLRPEEARLSAQRCFSCGTCNYCYNCYFFCPEGAVSLDPFLKTRTVDFDHCKGCGTCAKACPRAVVEMR